MKSLLTVIILIVVMHGLFAQNLQIRVPKPSPDAVFMLSVQEPFVDIEGYDGDDAIIEMIPRSGDTFLPEAAGLKKIPIKSRESSRGTNVMDVKVQQTPGGQVLLSIPVCHCEKVVIKVPNDSILRIDPEVFGKNGKLFVKNINNEVQVLGWAPVIELNNVAGFIMSTGGGNFLATNKIILSNINWTDAPVMMNGKLRPRNFKAGGISATIDVKLPRDLNANVYYVTQSGNTGGTFTNRSTHVKPDLEQVRNFLKSDGIDPKLQLLKMNQGGINISLRTQTGNINFGLED